jgi:hypothetical protein
MMPSPSNQLNQIASHSWMPTNFPAASPTASSPSRLSTSSFVSSTSRSSNANQQAWVMKKEASVSNLIKGHAKVKSTASSTN